MKTTKKIQLKKMAKIKPELSLQITYDLGHKIVIAS